MCVFVCVLTRVLREKGGEIDKERDGQKEKRERERERELSLIHI